jgi:putative two-component system response regulator
LHDIGKIGIPDNILLKPGRLDAEEWEVMKTHASIGEEVLGAALDAGERSEQQALFLRFAREIAGSHHERWDGSGYPRGLAGTEIPLAARLMSVADCYDALRSRRPYKEPWSHEEAMEELLKLKGSAFCPHVIDAAVHVQASFRETYDRYQD